MKGVLQGMNPKSHEVESGLEQRSVLAVNLLSFISRKDASLTLQLQGFGTTLDLP